MANSATTSLLASLQDLNAPQLRRLLVEHLTKQKLGLYWESNAIERDSALNANVVLPRLLPDASHTPPGVTHHHNLIIEGDNFDSLRLLRATQPEKSASSTSIHPTTLATRTGCTTTITWARTTAGGTANGWSFCISV